MSTSRIARGLFMLTLAAAACSSGAPSTSGQATYDVKESASQLAITGRDPQGAEVATLVLTVGRFTMQDDGRVVDGRQLRVRANGQEAVHESEGMQPIRLPVTDGAVTDGAGINQFLLEPVVKAALERWQVSLTLEAPSAQAPSAQASRTSPATEAPLYACTYGASALCGMSSCAEDHVIDLAATGCTVQTREYVCCGASKTAVYRWCGLGSANPCGVEGPLGCAVCWSYSWTTSCSAYGSGTYYYDSCDPGVGQFVYANGEVINMTYN